MAFSELILLICVLPTSGNALEHFEPRCTLPDTAVNIVESTNIRSTFAIFWDCMLVIFICIWSVQHLSVFPLTNEETTTTPSIRTKVCREAIERLKWMLLTILLPEIILGFAFQDWRMEKWFANEVIQKEIQKLREAEDEDIAGFQHWTATHTFFANMSGFAFRFHRVTRNQTEGQISGERRRDIVSLNLSLHRLKQETNISASEGGVLEPSEHRENAPSDLAGHPGDPGSAPIEYSQPTNPDEPTPETEADADSGDNLSSTSHSASSSDTSPTGIDDSLAEPIHEHEQPREPDNSSVNTTEHDVNIYAISDAFDAHDNLSVQSPVNQTEGSGQPDETNVTFYLNAPQIYAAYLMEVIPDLRLASEAEVSDKNKSDFFVKAAALAKLLFFFMTAILRLVKRLPISQLELTTAAFATCMIIAYLFYWNKPQGVSVPIVKEYPSISIAKAQMLREFSERSFLHVDLLPPSWNDEPIPSQEDKRRSKPRNLTEPVYNDALIGNMRLLGKVLIHYLEFAVAISSLLFGAIHIFAWWDFQFPNSFLRKMWLACSIAATGLPFLLSVANTIATANSWDYSWPVVVLRGAFALAYLFCRCFLVFESFHSLFFQPREVYVQPYP